MNECSRCGAKSNRVVTGLAIGAVVNLVPGMFGIASAMAPS